jgi:hypothetical protein
MPTLFRDRISLASVDPAITPQVVFNDFLSRPEGSVDFNIDLLDGWDTTSELNVISTPIGGGADGEVLGDFFEARARHLVAGGYVYAESREAAHALYDLLFRDAFPRNVDLELIRYEPTPKRIRVRVAGARSIAWTEPHAFRWNIPLMAGDPLKYGIEPSEASAGVAGLSSGGRTYPRTYPLVYATLDDGSGNKATIVNTGSADTFPVVNIHGPLPRGGWRLTNARTNEDIRFDVGLAATDVLTIDFKAETALLNGYPVTTTITGDFWRVKPGANDIKLFASFDPAAGFDITIYSAWE